MIREILTQGNPVLSQISEEVTLEALASAETQQLIIDMKHTLRHSGGIGLAAPQVGSLVRIIALTDPLLVIVNPVLTPVGEDQCSSIEGCLSVPGMTGEVSRHSTVRVQGMDPSGNPVDITCTKQRAVVLQHEVDHLNGILYTERARAVVPSGSPPPPAKSAAVSAERKLGGGSKTFVIDSGIKVSGKQFFAWTLHESGKVVAIRVQPGSAVVTGAWLSGMKLKAKCKAKDISLALGRLHVQEGDSLRIELQLPKGKHRIVAEADFDA